MIQHTDKNNLPKAIVPLTWSDLMILKICVEKTLQPNSKEFNEIYNKLETSFKELNNYIINEEHNGNA